MTDTRELSGKTALVTGGAKNIGRAIALELAAATARFLCGPGAAFITGQVVHVNGGQWMS